MIWTLLVLNLGFGAYFYLTDSFPWLMVFLNVVSCLYLGWLCIRPLVAGKTWPKTDKQKVTEIVIYTILFLIAWWLRTFRLESLPPGMWDDEVSAAVSALTTVNRLNFIPFVPDNFGHPTLLYYPSGFFLQTMGKTVLAIRLVSILFGCVDVCLFYFVAKKWVDRKSALIGTAIFITAYNQLVVSRFAYEMTAAVACLLLALFFLRRYLREHDSPSLIGLGLAVGVGTYTYLAFRILAVGLILLAILCPWKPGHWKETGRRILLLLTVLYISLTPMVAYAARHPDHMMTRVKSISVFNYGLSPWETAKEIGGALYRTITITFTTGDPNPRHNPSGHAAYDYISTVLLGCGLILLFREKNHLNIIIFGTLIILAMANDLFTLERVPEFHYYGLGHPNMLRLSLLTPLFYLIITMAIQRLHDRLTSDRRWQSYSPIIGLAVIAALINYSWYFYQPIGSRLYNYRYNSARELKVAQNIQGLKVGTVYASPTFAHDSRVTFFASSRVVEYTPQSSDLLGLPSGSYFFYDPKLQPQLTQDILINRQNDRMFWISYLYDPINRPDVFILRQF